MSRDGFTIQSRANAPNPASNRWRLRLLLRTIAPGAHFVESRHVVTVVVDLDLARPARVGR